MAEWLNERLNIRNSFLADKGCVLVMASLPQIEDRMCKMYCRTERMVELANMKPWGYDATAETAKIIFEKDEITKEEIYIGEKVAAGARRKLRGNKMSEIILKDTNGELFIHPMECDELIAAYHKAFPEIEEIYFPWVEQQVKDFRILGTSWGRRIDFRSQRLSSAIYEKAYSFYPRAEAADWMNQYLFIPTYWYMWERYGKAVNGCVSNEVVVSVPFEDAYDAAMVMTGSVQQTREIPNGSGSSLCVSAETTVAKNWGDDHGVKFKRLPEKGKFYKRLEEEGEFV